MTTQLHSVLFLVLLVVFGCINPAAANDNQLSRTDRTAIQSLLEQYRTAWLSGDADAVCRTFTNDAVLMPHHGVPPVVGMRAIKEFWWPASTAKITITHFTQTIDEVGGGGTIAFVRGRSEVGWRIEDHKVTENWRTAGNFMAVLRKQSDGKWLMSHLIWDDPPNRRLQ